MPPSESVTCSTDSSSLRSYLSLAGDRVVVCLVIVFVAAFTILLWHQSRVQENLISTTMLEAAERQTQALSTFRTLYTSNVVETVRHQGIEVTHDYKQGDKKGRAIPLPATMSMELGNAISKHERGGRTRLYSPFPFPYVDRNGLEDEFAKAAWATLSHNPTKPFYRFEEVEGRPVLRYATADLMRKSCVNCHNSHRDSPKRDWKEGDLRGVLEVTLPLETVATQKKEETRQTIILMIGIAVFGLLTLSLVIGRIRRSSVQAEIVPSLWLREISVKPSTSKAVTSM